MYSKAELKKYSDAVATIKSITRVYEEAAARRIKLVQLSVEKIDDFVAAAADTYLNVKFGLLAEQKGKKTPVQNILTTSFRKKLKKGVLVLITSKDQYYGNLIPNIYRNWHKDMQETKFDGIVLGNTGEHLLEKEQTQFKNVEFFDLDDSNIDWKVIYRIGEQISQYEKIVVYFGAYKTVLTQVAEKTDISNSISVGQVQKVKRYLFESKGEEILSDVEKDVIKAQLQRRIYQSQIAKYAARIKILEIGQVAEKMSQVLGDLSRGKKKVHKNLNNKKQLQLYTGVDLWKE